MNLFDSEHWCFVSFVSLLFLFILTLVFFKPVFLLHASFFFFCHHQVTDDGDIVYVFPSLQTSAIGVGGSTGMDAVDYEALARRNGLKVHKEIRRSRNIELVELGCKGFKAAAQASSKSSTLMCPFFFCVGSSLKRGCLILYLQGVTHCQADWLLRRSWLGGLQS